ncbi:MAG: hypothetical protein GY862_04375 [Gammaproteobacteria bacterium]|nr:hypothetical protein [Gammaproteobacteria bacterium]
MQALETLITIQLQETDYHHLTELSDYLGKSIQEMFQEWVSGLPEIDEYYDVTKDSVFQMEGYESDAPADLSIHIDKYLYGNDLKISLAIL